MIEEDFFVNLRKCLGNVHSNVRNFVLWEGAEHGEELVLDCVDADDLGDSWDAHQCDQPVQVAQALVQGDEAGHCMVAGPLRPKYLAQLLLVINARLSDREITVFQPGITDAIESFIEESLPEIAGEDWELLYHWKSDTPIFVFWGQCRYNVYDGVMEGLDAHNAV